MKSRIIFEKTLFVRYKEKERERERLNKTLYNIKLSLLMKIKTTFQEQKKSYA